MTTKPEAKKKRRSTGVAAPAPCSASGRKTDDTGVPRRYFEAAKNPMFSPVQTACVSFVQYAESVPCALCGRQSKYHWTCVVRFKAANTNAHQFILKLSRNYFKAGAPVCRDHPTQPDEADVHAESARRPKEAERRHQRPRQEGRSSVIWTLKFQRRSERNAMARFVCMDWFGASKPSGFGMAGNTGESRSRHW